MTPAHLKAVPAIQVGMEIAQGSNHSQQPSASHAIVPVGAVQGAAVESHHLFLCSPSCDNVAPRPTLLAFVSTMKGFRGSGYARAGAPVSVFHNCLNTVMQSSFHENPTPLCVRQCRGQQSHEPAWTKKLRISPKFWGTGQSFTAATLASSMATPSPLAMWPRNVICWCKRWHSLRWRQRTPVIVLLPDQHDWSSPGTAGWLHNTCHGHLLHFPLSVRFFCQWQPSRLEADRVNVPSVYFVLD